MELISKGFIVQCIYPIMSKYNKLPMTLKKGVFNFLRIQPENVKKLLLQESEKYKNTYPYSDPLPRIFIPTPHPDIFYSRPKRFQERTLKTPMFFCCPECRGRLFWGMKKCGWCGVDVMDKVKPEDSEDIKTYLNFANYVFIRDETPSIANALVVFNKITIDEGPGEIVPINEFNQILKNIKKFIPSTAYAK